MEDIKKAEEIFSIIKNLSDKIEKNKKCDERVIITDIYKGINIDVFSFLAIINFIVKNYANDYIKLKDGTQIKKSELKSITYYINFNNYLANEPLCYLEYHFKKSSFNEFMPYNNSLQKIVFEF